MEREMRMFGDGPPSSRTVTLLHSCPSDPLPAAGTIGFTSLMRAESRSVTPSLIHAASTSSGHARVVTWASADTLPGRDRSQPATPALPGLPKRERPLSGPCCWSVSRLVLLLAALACPRHSQRSDEATQHPSLTLSASTGSPQVRRRVLLRTVRLGVPRRVNPPSKISAHPSLARGCCQQTAVPAHHRSTVTHIRFFFVLFVLDRRLVPGPSIRWRHRPAAPSFVSTENGRRAASEDE